MKKTNPTLHELRRLLATVEGVEVQDADDSLVGGDWIATVRTFGDSWKVRKARRKACRDILGKAGVRMLNVGSSSILIKRHRTL